MLYAEEDVALSDWTITEFYSAIGCTVRDKRMTIKEANLALAELNQRLQQGIITYQLDPDDHILAQSYMLDWHKAPKGADALHIAAARRLSAKLLTHDTAMAKHAQACAVQSVLVKS
jgi:predicted nucleic acid-binding protein